ncbi:hypothetical protein CGCF415_v011946 [Colletotrichum fructicola]|uniref:Uncharacterized protein n=2 Tax=Colletotrichum gloeosporioides species complex TaxID=2707338 RepID=A0A7J6JPD3_COLFN|nr:uncharacterized protein CGMCC3_g16926 [Colletotrichum fructicola]KAF4492399.1 hypothetical protein CGGC5_v002513 [Colletotrichum fructicola Nara gc5]KAF4821049.1 hypothetical protein CGCSCA5_v003639 [Colletotrichum siamense]KAE9566925.1 hypothetical protein CGMCC3_g16926 [Colletotrichum fructicola]KAF4833157.1 hypothetical protein CGCSCA4_v013368 [Colletotrichum siamense]KAF4855788.1 hypothetical protein CGCSCA2_v008732 [Colletotrichum siamense]
MKPKTKLFPCQPHPSRRRHLVYDSHSIRTRGHLRLASPGFPATPLASSQRPPPTTVRQAAVTSPSEPVYDATLRYQQSQSRAASGGRSASE